jgi:aminoglycoside 6'-N-acetyltransferase
MATDTVSQGPADGGAYRFRPLTADDLPLLERWLAEPHTRRWWGAPADELGRIVELMAADWAELYLVDYCPAEGEGGPIAYLQAYDGAADPDADWPGLSPGTWGIDTFIGPPDAAGRGHGPAYLRQFSDLLLARPGVRRLSVDPDPDNRQAIRAYEKAGFIAERRATTADGDALLMFRDGMVV